MRWLRGLYLDRRSLALFRIALGLCVIADTLVRLPQVEAFYSDQGILPREAVFEVLEGTWAVSLHLISGQAGVQVALMLATLVFAAGMVLGYRTRFCIVACWFLVMSLQVRNSLVLHAGDDLLRMLLFWSMFLPLHGRFSLDRALNPAAPKAATGLLSPGGLALIFQICAMYWYTAAHKMHPVWVSERSAVYYALSLDQFATPFGKFLLQFPGLLQVLSSGTLVLEMLGPLLVLSPVWTAPLRLVGVGLFLSFHAGLGLTLHLGLFPWVCAAAWLVFLPAPFWDFLSARFGRRWIPTDWDRAWRLPARLTPPPPRERPGLAAGVAALVALVLVEATLARRPTLDLDALKPIENRLIQLGQLGQSWRMFAPYPDDEDGWYVIEGLTRDGRRVDIWNGGGPPRYEKPADVWALYRNSQWQKYLVNLWQRRNRRWRPYFGGYLCREWNRQHGGPDQIELVYAKYMLEVTPPPGQPAPTAIKESVFRYTCYPEATPSALAAP